MARVLLVGSDARTHAIAAKLAAHRHDVFVAEGNGGTAQCAHNVPIAPTDFRGLIDFAKGVGVHLTVVLPELPLSLGIVDAFEKEELWIYGPTRRACIEASKAEGHLFSARHGIPRPPNCAIFDNLLDVEVWMRFHGYKGVIKVDGLAAGKGAFVCQSKRDVEEALALIGSGIFGEAAKLLVYEGLLSGEELSIVEIVSGVEHVSLLKVRDYKLLNGKNTGGMGAWGPVRVDPQHEAYITEKIIMPAIRGFKKEGRPYFGTLFPGLMRNEREEFRLLEFNSRFPDPESQVLMELLQSDLYPLLKAVAYHQPELPELEWRSGFCVNVVAAAEGYPGDVSASKGRPISGIEHAQQFPGVSVYHAGTKIVDGKPVVNGGRVLNVTARHQELYVARENAYNAMSRIHFEGMQIIPTVGLV